MHCMADQLLDTLIFRRTDRYHRNSQDFFQFIDIDRTAVIAHLIHHIQCQYHRNSQLHKLHGQTQVSLNICGIHDIDDSVRLAVQ